MDTQNTNPFIESIQVNLFGGIFNTKIEFRNGLNIISGENGTGKTQLINQIKTNSNKKFFEGRTTNRIIVFNPLRNAEKRTREEIERRLKSQDLSLKKINEILRGIGVDDQNVSRYYSFGEIFMLTYEDLLDNGDISKEEAVNKTRDKFNQVLQRVFPEYEIIAQWEDRHLNLFVKKKQNITIPLNGLSRGESEVFALLFNIYANRDQEDIFLIDEPELHLNWSLERGLFRFLDWFCEKFKKQIIVATHSRIIFESGFLSKTQFLSWENGHIVIKNKPTDDIRQNIAGDALRLITAFDINKSVFYVEDEMQKRALEFLKDYYSKDYFVVIAKGKSNVQNLCRYLTSEGYSNAYFLVDGDNQGVPKEFEKNKQYIQLRKYNIENYFLDSIILAKICGKKENDIKNIIKEAIKNSPESQHTKVFKKLAEISDIPNEILDTYNAKKIIKMVYESLGLKYPESIDKFLEECKEDSKVEKIFGEITEVVKKI